MKAKRLIIFCDGGAFNNPGPAAIGIIFYNENGKKLLEFSKFLGRATNNQAEYQAVIHAFEIAKKKFQPKEIQFFIDSKLIVEQLNGNYKLKNQNLKPLYYLAKEWQLNFPLVLYNYIPREKNQLADKLVKAEIKRNLFKR
jgi:ribonuclease HI